MLCLSGVACVDTTTVLPAGVRRVGRTRSAPSSKVDCRVAVRRTCCRGRDPYAAVVTWRSWWRGHRSAIVNAAIAVVLFGVELGASLVPPAPVVLRVLGVVAAVALGAAALDALVRTQGSVALPFAGYALGRYQPPGRLRWTAVALTALAGLQPWTLTSVAALPGHLAGAG